MLRILTRYGTLGIDAGESRFSKYKNASRQEREQKTASSGHRLSCRAAGMPNGRTLTKADAARIFFEMPDRQERR